jgi:hypothetical protein
VSDPDVKRAGKPFVQAVAKAFGGQSRDAKTVLHVTRSLAADLE